MKRVLLYATFAIGAWVLASFGGAMFDPARAEFWTQSLMASLIASLIIAPFIFIVQQRTPSSSPQKQADVSAGTGQPSGAQASDTDEPFVSDEADRLDTLWPQPQEESRSKERAEA